jgi:ABC-type uncharacterized transport system involved in gliding motility auxiliary subunit
VEIRFYCTQGEKEVPAQFKVYSQHIDDLLSEYKQYGRNNVKIKRLNPKPDSDAEDSAKLDGVEGQMLSNGESLYMGVAISALDEKVAIPFLSPERERLLEYDITRAISRVAAPQKPVLGVMTPLPMFGQPMNPMMARMGQQQGQEAWVVVSEWQKDFTVKQVQMDVDKIDDDIKVLMVVHPKDISDKAQYAIDQFIMRGGKLIAYLDGNCVIDNRNAQQNPMMGMMGGGGSTMDKLLKTWGINFDTSKVVADATFTSRFVRNGKPEAAPAVLSMNASGINKDDVVTSQIDSLLIPFAGVFTGTPAQGLKQTVLLKTTAESQLVEGIMATMSGEQITRDFKPSGTQYAVAIRLAGKFKSAFPEGKPADTKPGDKDEKKDEKKSADDSLKESKGETAVILIGDADMLYDQFSVQVQNVFGQKIVIPRNGNLNLAQNAVEQMAGDSNLIAVRSRATMNRPFTVVQNMQAKAESDYRSKIKQLEEGLQETQRKINELQAKKEKGQRFILSPEQQKEIEKFRKDENEAKKELKRVRKDLRQDIDSLENKVKWINIAGMPVLVAAFGIGLAVFRGQRAKSKAS